MPGNPPATVMAGLDPATHAVPPRKHSESVMLQCSKHDSRSPTPSKSFYKIPYTQSIHRFRHNAPGSNLPPGGDPP
jgi:hypothetical protein